MMLSLSQRLAGSLLGQAVGDALGVAVESAPAADARAYVDTCLRVGRAGEPGRGAHAFGQYTDDTQLARELLLAYRDARGFDPGAFARRLAALAAAGALVGAGPGTRAAAHRLLGGACWHEAGEPSPYPGNGAAMRAGPIGLLAESPAALARAACAQARVTHQDPRCAAGAVAVATAVRLAAGAPCGPGAPRADTAPIAREGFVTELVRAVRAVDPRVAGVLAGMREWGGEPPERAFAALADCCAGEGVALDAGVAPHVVPSVAWSVYAFLLKPDDYWETVCTAIWAGGDTDTLAAMAGAMSGARLGPAAIPRPLVSRVGDAGEWRAAALVRLAGECGRLADAYGSGSMRVETTSDLG